MADGDLHVIPDKDSFEHEAVADCPCGPEVKRQITDGKPGKTIYVHQALGTVDG